MKTPKNHIEVLGSRMAYVEEGEGRPILLLHGNPTSSFLWRDVIAELRDRARCIAPDLIGMGDSEKIDSLYRFDDHRHHLDAFMEEMGLDSEVVLVGHDWGGALLFDWASRHESAIDGIAFMETIVAPLEWEDWPEAARNAFQRMRSDDGEAMVLGKNFFVERILPASVIRDLPADVMEEYRRPFPTPETRIPTLRWPREIPIDGTPVDMVETVSRFSDFMARTEIPKLFVNADPGSILVGPQRELVRTWPNQREVTVPGLHFIQEDSGREIGQAIGEFLDSL